MNAILSKARNLLCCRLERKVSSGHSQKTAIRRTTRAAVIFGRLRRGYRRACIKSQDVRVQRFFLYLRLCHTERSIQ